MSLEAKVAELEAKLNEVIRSQDAQAAAFLEFILKYETRMNDVLSHYRKQVELVLANATK
jgi:hypothetical protein